MTVSSSTSGGPCTLAGWKSGALAIAPITPVIATFGMSFGVAATDAGLPAWTATAMSATVMAGGAQFAALELWHQPSPWLPLVLTVLAINSRHFLFGATLSGWLQQFRPRSRRLAVAVISDPSWALTDAAIREGQQDIGYLLGCGTGLWVSWVGGTIAGIAAGDLLAEQIDTFGLDTLLFTYFATLLVPRWAGRASVAPWIVAGAVAVYGRDVLPDGWNVIAAAACGGLIGAVTATRRTPNTP